MLRQFKEEKRVVIAEIASSARTVVWKILRVYALMMSITFVELHPIVTLFCIFAGAQLIGVLGIFTFPVIATMIKKMNDEGTIRVFK